MCGKKRMLARLVLGGSLLLGTAGGCLPDNFFATLAGDVLADVVQQIVNAVVGGVLGTG